MPRKKKYESKGRAFTIYIPESLLKKIDELAEKLGKSRSEIINEALKKYLELGVPSEEGKESNFREEEVVVEEVEEEKEKVSEEEEEEEKKEETEVKKYNPYELLSIVPEKKIEVVMSKCLDGEVFRKYMEKTRKYWKKLWYYGDEVIAFELIDGKVFIKCVEPWKIVEAGIPYWNASTTLQ